MRARFQTASCTAAAAAHSELEFGHPARYQCGASRTGGCGLPVAVSRTAIPPARPRAGSSEPSPQFAEHHFEENGSMSMYIGEALSGEGNEIAHIDLLIGDKTGPVGVAFANALANQSAGHSNLLAVLTPNLLVKPATVMITKVTIKGAKQAVQMFGPAQYAVAKAVADSVEAGVIPKDQCDTLVIVCGVFIHWEANDDKKIFQYNYNATKLAIARAMKNEPSASEMLSKKATAKHPFAGV
jgi:5,6,7,8-tetrahydromethanopterin hydro-lyase